MKTGYVDFDFFGQSIRMLGGEHDLIDARFFYGGHLAPPDMESPELLVELSCCDLEGRGFFASLLAKDRLRKRITLRSRAARDREGEKSIEFTSWSDAASPLPPFRDSALWERLATYSGAVLAAPGGRGVTITGANYVGKTAASLELARRGYVMVSDSVVVLDTLNGGLLPYLSPIGYRRENLRVNYEWIRSVPHRETISPDTGLVVLVRPEDAVPGEPGKEAVRFDVLVHVRREGQELSTTTVRTPDIGWYTGVPRSRVDSFVPRSMYVVTVPENAPPEAVADQIEKVVAR